MAAAEVSAQQHYSAHDRTQEWHSCCLDIFMGRDSKRQRLAYELSNGRSALAFGGDDDDSDDDNIFLSSYSSPGSLAIDMTGPGSRSSLNNMKNISEHVIGENVPLTKNNDDSWMRAALALSASIDEVSRMIQQKATSYVSSTDTFNIVFQNEGNKKAGYIMTNADRAILETTVASFAAGMAKQIESLRQTVVVEGDHPFLKSPHFEEDSHEKGSINRASRHWATGPVGHRAGIASCLMQRLKSEIMDPMTSLQMQREKFVSKNKDKSNFSDDDASKIAENPLRGFRINAEDAMRRPLPPAPWELGGRRSREYGWTEQDRDQEDNEFLCVYFEENLEKESSAASLEVLTANSFPPPTVLKFLDVSKTKATTGQAKKMNEVATRQRQYFAFS